MLKRIGKILFVFLLVLGLLVAASLIWATSESGSQKISEWVRDLVREELRVEASFENIDLNFFPPRIAVRNVRARDMKHRIDCTVEEAELAPDVMDLIAGSPTIEEIYLGSPHCLVKLDTEGIDELVAAAAKDTDQSDKPKLDISALPEFEVFAVSDGKIEATIEDPDRAGRMEVVVDGLGLDITGGKSSVEVRGMIEDAHCTWEKGDKYLDEGLEGFEFRAGITPESVELRHLFASIAGAGIRARDAHIPIPLWPRGPRVSDISVDVPLEMLARIPVDLPPMWGRAGFLGQVSAREGTDGKPEISARGRVQLKDGKVDDFVIGDLKGLVSLAPQGISVSEVELETAEGKMVVDGNVAFDEVLTSNFTTQLHGIELAHLLENVTMDGAQVTQYMSGTITAKGQINPLKLDASLRLDVKDHTVLSDGFRKRGSDVLLHLPRSSVSGRVKITDEQVVARGLDVRFGGSHVGVDLKFGLGEKDGWELDARSNHIILDDIEKVAGLTVAGRGRLKCKIVDPVYGDPRITGNFHFQRMGFSGFDFDEVAGNVSFRGSSLIFSDLTIQSDKSVYTSSEVDLEFGGRAGLTIAAKVEAERIAIEDLAKSFHIDTAPYGKPTGFLYGRIALDYSMRPDRLRIEASLDHDRLTVFGERFGTDSMSFVWDDGNLTVDQLDLPKGGGKISVTGALNRDGALNFMGVATEVDLQSIDHPTIKKLGIDATAQAFIVVDGTTDHPTGSADLRISEAIRGDMRYDPSHVEVTLDDRLVTAKGRVGGDTLSIEFGQLDLAAETFVVEGFAYKLDLVPTLQFDTKGHKASLEITGEVALSGKLSETPRLTGWASMQQVHFSVDDFEFKNRTPVEISARKDRFTLARTRFKGKDITFDLAGKADLERIYNLNLNGMVDLTTVADLVGPVTGSDGKLIFDGRIKGKWDDPLFRGDAQVQKGEFIIRGFPSPIEDVSGKIVLGAKKIGFTGFKGRCAGGDLDMSGQITLSGLDVSDYLFRMTMQDLELQLYEDLSFKASTTREGLLLRPGDRDLPTITGDIEISNLRYSEDLQMIELSDLSVDRLTGTRLRTKKPRVFDEKKDAFAFDINLHGSRRLEVRNNVLDARLRIDDVEEPLRLVGTNQSYGFLGRVLGTRGQIRMFGKTFNIRYAAVSFRDPLRPENPHFRVTADGQVRDWKVTISAQGTVDDYEIKISSQPYLSQQDLVFLLLTGMTKAEHHQFGSSGLARIGTSFLGPVGGDVIPLEVQIYTEYSEKAGTDTTRISLGKWITENIWAAFSSSLGEERDIEANIDYRINDNLSISVDFDNESQAGNLGIDLKYRKEF